MAKSKGYRPFERKTRRTAFINFAEDHEFHGFEASVGLAAPMEFLLSIEGIDSQPTEVKRDLMHQFGEAVLLSWNVEDRNGAVVPANGDGFMAQDYDLCIEILKAWGQVMATPVPLET